MDQLVEVSIPRTHTRKKDALFNSFFTVYEVKVILDDSYEYILFKRYKEFRNLHDYVKETLGEKYTFPKFPGRTVNSMNPAVISKRKSGLQKWMHEALTRPEIETMVKKFLEIPSNIIEHSIDQQKLNEDEVLIKEFATNINMNPHSRINIIDSFDKKYFNKRRNTRENYMGLLINTLVPMCGDEYFGSKALFFLYKLCTSDHHRDFELAMKELVKLPIEVLKQIRLEEYLLRRRFCESQIQAFQILGIISSQLEPSVIEEILNNDLEAVEVFSKWTNQRIISKPVTESFIVSSEWREIASSDNRKEFQVSFRFINKELQFHSNFILESDPERIITLFTQPIERKQWDMKLQSIEELPRSHDNLCLRLLYLQDRNLYEFHVAVSINRSISHSTIHFKSKNFNIPIKGILGKMTCCFKIEDLTRKDSSFISSPKTSGLKRTSSSTDVLEEETEKINASLKVSWKATFCEASKKLYMSDCLQETEIIKQSFAKLIQIAESRNLQVVENTPENTILEACERKKLRKLLSLRKMSVQDDFY